MIVFLKSNHVETHNRDTFENRLSTDWYQRQLMEYYSIKEIELKKSERVGNDFDPIYYFSVQVSFLAIK